MPGQILGLVAVPAVLLIAVAGCGSSSSAKYQTTVTDVATLGPSKVGVAFQVKNVGKGAGTPTCQIIAAVSANNGGVKDITLPKIGPGQYDYVATSDAVVSISGVGADAITATNGDVQVTCE